MDAARLQRCLNPRSIAVVGGAEAGRVIRRCRELGFDGDVWAVNPRRARLEGVACYGDVAALPAAPDAAFVAISAAASIDAVAVLSRLGAGGAVCYASGFGEAGAAGVARQQRLRAAAAAMPIIGPNCYGFINLLSGAALWPDYHGAARAEGGVAIFSQSGNVSLNLSMQQRQLPLAWLVTLGNQAMVGLEEGLAAALAEKRITAIGLHLEGLRDVRRLVELATQARRQKVPIVALKVGRSAIGARITFSHTATLAGEGALYDALFERLGIAQVATPQEFIETLKLLSMGGPLRGRRLASLSCSGGEATLIADLAAARALEFPPLDDAHRRRVQATLNAYTRVDNPLDYHTFIWGDEARMRVTFCAMLDGDFDLAALILDTPPAESPSYDIWARAAQAFIDACAQSGCRGAVIASLAENLPPELARMLIAHGITPLHGLEQGLAAIEAAAAVGMNWARGEKSGWRAPILGWGLGGGVSAGDESADESSTGESFRGDASTAEQNHAADGELVRIESSGGHESADESSAGEQNHAHGDTHLITLDEHQAKQWLAGIGLPVAESRVADSVAAAAAAAAELGYPVAVKALAAHLAHKTELGGVALGLRDGAQVQAHSARMLGFAPRVLVEKMVDNAVAEMLLGVGYDPQFGHYMSIGFGGALVELIADRALLLPPITEAMLTAVIAGLKTAALLHGYRNRPPADLSALLNCAMRLGHLIESGALNSPHAPAAAALNAAAPTTAAAVTTAWQSIAEIEINPLIVKSQGHGAVVTDALMVVRVAKKSL